MILSDVFKRGFWFTVLKKILRPFSRIGLASVFFQKKTSFGLSRLTRNAIVNEMEDGWMVVDLQNLIIDINPSAEILLGISKQDVYGKPISEILIEWPNIVKSSDTIKELEMRRSVKGENRWRYISVRISKITDQNKGTLGRLIIWRDQTEQKLVENSRQRAREELFVLLNSISSAASHAMSLDEFLLETIDQICFTFQSQAIGVFLFDQDAGTLTLTSHLGLSQTEVEKMHIIPAGNGLWDEIVRTNQNIRIDNFNDHFQMPPGMRRLTYSDCLILPLSIRLQDTVLFLGCIFLAKEKQTYTNDEIFRLNMISEHISMLIDNNRRRNLFIVSSERQRLQRDLHDSVSQKLYGLVTMAEAAQAGFEAGSQIDPYKILIKMGENARQAVREMRLFLYQMQPVDLENEGLVSVLNHRLAAVEGRANIKTRFLADEEVALSADKELALYFIAQEALNNILKHANAHSVSLTLKNSRQKVVFEIQDNGAGFDIKKVDGAGLGLKNMQYRATQIDGKLKISSKPGKGTKISVQVSREK